MSIPFFVLGAAAWSASEYVIHRFIGHGPRRKPAAGILGRITPSGLAAEFNREHLAHHSDPTYFAPTRRKVLAASAAAPLVVGALLPVVGVRRAASFTLGFTATYAAYEILHRRIHTHAPPASGRWRRYGRWLRRHHLLHHYKTPRANHGVTSPIWDVVFDTEKPLDRIRVPRRHAPAWLVDETGDVRVELREDYELVPSASDVRAARPGAGPGPAEGRPGHPSIAHNAA